MGSVLGLDGAWLYPCLFYPFSSFDTASNRVVDAPRDKLKGDLAEGMAAWAGDKVTPEIGSRTLAVEAVRSDVEDGFHV